MLLDEPTHLDPSGIRWLESVLQTAAFACVVISHDRYLLDRVSTTVLGLDGEVKQIITGSIGFDDWEWGVDLWADDPLVFKKLIYEMRFDEVSAVYALFGHFYVGMRCAAADLGKLLSGELPKADSQTKS